jgi:hypothetical protein
VFAEGSSAGWNVAVERERRDWAAGSARESEVGEVGRREGEGLGEAPGRLLEEVTTGGGVAGSGGGGGVAGGVTGGGDEDHCCRSSCLTVIMDRSSSSLEGGAGGERRSLLVGVTGLLGALLLFEVVSLVHSPSALLLPSKSSVSLLLGPPGFSPLNLGVLRTGVRSGLRGVTEGLRDSTGLEEISFPLILS